MKVEPPSITQIEQETLQALRFAAQASFSPEIFRSTSFFVALEHHSQTLVARIETMLASKCRTTEESHICIKAAPKTFWEAIKMALDLIGLRKHKWIEEHYVQQTKHVTVCPHTGLEFEPRKHDIHLAFLNQGWMPEEQQKVQVPMAIYKDMLYAAKRSESMKQVIESKDKEIRRLHSILACGAE